MSQEGEKLVMRRKWNSWGKENEKESLHSPKANILHMKQSHRKKFGLGHSRREF